MIATAALTRAQIAPLLQQRSYRFSEVKQAARHLWQYTTGRQLKLAVFFTPCSLTGSHRNGWIVVGLSTKTVKKSPPLEKKGRQAGCWCKGKVAPHCEKKLVATCDAIAVVAVGADLDARLHSSLP
jgi:hypothetical protein